MSQKALVRSWKDEIAHERDENLDEDKGNIRRQGWKLETTDFSWGQVWSPMKGELRMQPGGALRFDERKGAGRGRWRHNGQEVESENCVVDPGRSGF